MTICRNFVCFMIIAASCIVAGTKAVMFDLAKIGPDNHNEHILTAGNGTYISDQGIQLANRASVESRSKAGRATYSKLLHLWDKASGWLADFTTDFSFVMDPGGDGLSFFLSRNNSRISGSRGSMGLPVVVNSSNTHTAVASSPFIAVEFDTYWNPNWDPVVDRKSDVPIGDHVGININSLVSVKAQKWWRSNITQGKECFVEIRYDSTSLNLSVTFSTGFHKKKTMVPDQLELHYKVDLRRVLPEWVIFGFSASSSSGDKFQRNTVRSWSFNSSDLHVNEKNNNGISVAIIVAIVVVLVLVLVVMVLALCYVFFWKKQKKTIETPIPIVPNGIIVEPKPPQSFAYEQLEQATDYFNKEKKLGHGGFGAVYEGVLSDGRRVAVKAVSPDSEEAIKGYVAEVMIVSKSNHRHLVQLIGWCHEREEQLLIVYELMENRSLDRHLFNAKMPPLAWGVSYKIALGLAKALRYLHEGHVLHRDIKSSNVMLDSVFDAKLGDFGLAKLLSPDRSLQISAVAGTRGYIALEYIQTGNASLQSDVYSYGVVVLEIATGRKAIFANAREDERILVVHWVQEMYEENKIMEAADPRLGNVYDELQMKGLLLLGLWCTCHEPHERPSMEEVVSALNNQPQDLLSYIQDKIPTSFRSPPLPATMLEDPSLSFDDAKLAEPAYTCSRAIHLPSIQIHSLQSLDDS